MWFLTTARFPLAGKSGESPAALLQLPHFDNDVLKKLARKKVKTLTGAFIQSRFFTLGLIGFAFGYDLLKKLACKEVETITGEHFLRGKIFGSVLLIFAVKKHKLKELAWGKG